MPWCPPPYDFCLIQSHDVQCSLLGALVLYCFTVCTDIMIQLDLIVLCLITEWSNLLFPIDISNGNIPHNDHSPFSLFSLSCIRWPHISELTKLPLIICPQPLQHTGLYSVLEYLLKFDSMSPRLSFLQLEN